MNNDHVVDNFNLSGKPFKVTVNRNCVLIEPESDEIDRTVIPLNLVIAIRTCFCDKSKKAFCKCLKSEENQNLFSSTGHLSDPQNGDNNNQKSGLKINHVRLFYAQATGKFAYKLSHLTLDPIDQSESHLQQWIEFVNSLLAEFDRPKRLMVFINPYGGKRRGPKIYTQKVLPLLKIAGCTDDCVITQRANHAHDLILDTSFPVTSYDGLICVGGDGMFSELLNSLLLRTQKEADIDYKSTSSILQKPLTPIGVIPAGSTDAVCFGVCGNNDPVTAALHIILGNKVNIDVSAVHSARDEEQLIRYATTLLGYGFLGDVMQASEKVRWMGPKRYDWVGFKKVLGLRTYQGELKLHISTEDGSPKDTQICASECQLCAKAAIRHKLEQESSNKNKPDDDGVVCMAIKGGFLAVNAVTMSCRCEKSKKGLSPAAHLGNGCADLIVVSKCSRVDYLRYLMRLANPGKSPFDLDFVDVYRVREFEFNPIIRPGSSSKRYKISDASVWNCDGEIVSEPALHVKVHCQLLPIFGNGGENRKSRSKKIFSFNSKNMTSSKVHPAEMIALQEPASNIIDANNEGNID